LTTGFASYCRETQLEAQTAATAAFRFALQSADAVEPLLVVVITIYPADAQRVGMTLAFVLTDVVFLTRIDVGVIIKYGRADVVSQHPLYNS
jgi:hypothetical protein